jgi:integrase
VAPSRLQSCRSRSFGGSSRRSGSSTTQRPSSRADRRRISRPILAAGQATRPGSQHLRRIPTSGASPPRSPYRRHPALRGLRTERLEQLYSDLLDHGNTRTGLGLSPKTVLDVHVIIRSALDDAVRRGLLRTNPAKAAHAPKNQRNRCRADRVWTADQLTAFLHLAEDRRQHPSFWLAANTGMRRGELLGLRWNAIDIRQRRLSVNRSVVSVAARAQESGGKTRNSPRTIDLDPTTIGVLARWRRRQTDELGRSENTMPLHTKTDGHLIHPQTLSQAFERAVATTTLPPISLHDLRHTHATLLLKAGVPLKVVSERLGHSSPAFTMATYQHVLPGMQADAADTFAALLQNGSSNGFYPEETR